MISNRLVDNPYFILELTTQATPVEIERAGQKLQSMLLIGAANARQYSSPFGPQPRDEAKVRSAVAALRDPAERLLHQFWAEGATNQQKASTLPQWDAAFVNVRWSVTCPRH